MPDSGAVASPITLDELKAHLRVDGDLEDAALAAYSVAAAAGVERYCGDRIMLRRTFTRALDYFPGYRRPITLPAHPAVSVVSIVYTDASGAEVTLDPSLYRLVTGSPRVFGEVEPVEGECWPVDTIEQRGCVVVTYTAGYAADIGGADAVPAAMRMAVRQWAGTMYRLRESVANFTPAEVPHGIAMLLSTYRTPNA